MRWVEEGKDIEAWLPYLAAYMGHQKYSSTAWYVHLFREATTTAITVVDSKPQGGIARPSVKRGDHVVLIVKSDTADEIHVHGYDLFGRCRGRRHGAHPVRRRHARSLRGGAGEPRRTTRRDTPSRSAPARARPRADQGPAGPDVALLLGRRRRARRVVRATRPPLARAPARTPRGGAGGTGRAQRVPALDGAARGRADGVGAAVRARVRDRAARERGPFKNLAPTWI